MRSLGWPYTHTPMRRGAWGSLALREDHVETQPERDSRAHTWTWTRDLGERKCLLFKPPICVFLGAGLDTLTGGVH